MHVKTKAILILLLYVIIFTYNRFMQIFADKNFENPIEIIQAFDNESFIEAFRKIEILRKRPDLYLLGYIRYEAKEIFLKNGIKSDLPLLYFEIYEKTKCKMQKIKNSCNNLSTNQLITSSTLNYQEYATAISQIKEEIANGNTYEVNYTYDYKIETKIDGFDLYNAILPNQTTPYNTYIKNEFEEILCFSPELFFELEDNKIKTKPMKGTVKRGQTESEDKENIEFLKNDEKNRAENVMIVDLLRNDLGKIAKTGSVKVDKLFEVETHKTIHQMTSEISAELENNTTLFEIFEAIFPCGSITGAPKINTMKIIDEVEIGTRGVYCGAIGLITSEKTVFSVPIRTLQRKYNENFYTCRVGGAIVWDSTAEDEWEETLTKIEFLKTNSDNDEKTETSKAKSQEKALELPHTEIKLIETILVEKKELKYKDEHFARLKKSAKELGFKYTQWEPKKGKRKKDREETYILRILLSKNGTYETQHHHLNEIQTQKVTISKTPINSSEKLLYYKSTYRPWYDEAMEKIKSGEIFDEIFFNEKGELTEGSRSNVLLQIDGQIFTPSVNCGLLKGVLRQKMIKTGGIIEKKLYLDDLKKAEKVFCINSVRGIVEVEVEW